MKKNFYSADIFFYSLLLMAVIAQKAAKAVYESSGGLVLHL